MEPGLQMGEIGQQSVETAPVDGDAQWNVETIIEDIWSDLGGVTPRAEIRNVLMEAAPVYENVRIKAFVPIFLRRDVLRRLQNDAESANKEA